MVLSFGYTSLSIEEEQQEPYFFIFSSVGSFFRALSISPTSGLKKNLGENSG